jgi:hypothetical protein
MKINHTQLLHDPKTQMALLNTTSVRLYSKAMLLKINSGINSGNSGNIFNSSFKTEEISKEFMLYVVRMAQSVGCTEPVILPPLMLRSNFDSVVNVNSEINILCHISGPMIPFFSKSESRPEDTTITTLYSLHQKEYVESSDALKRIMS